MAPYGYTPLHDITDHDKVAGLADEMTHHGWQGAPLVAWDDHLITGVHRIAAAEQAEVEPLVVQLEDIFVEAGISWDDALEDASCYDFGVAAVILCSYLPETIKDKYGIDVE